jgi:hypothetical protein
MLAVDVRKGAFEQLAELLVGRLERRIRQVDVGRELSRPAEEAPARTTTRIDRSYAARAACGGAMRRVSTATSAWVPSPWRRVTPENPTPGVTYSVLRRGCEPMS